jgi:hypothetical protein
MPTATTSKGLGWRPNLPDYRDRQYKFGNALRAELKPEAAIPPRAQPQRKEVNRHGVLNQLMSSGCTGHGVGLCAAVERNVSKRAPLFIYYEARRLIGETDVDNGAYIRDAAKVVSTLGAPSYGKWPTSMDKVLEDPSAAADRDALKRKLFTYHSVETRQEILSCLAGGHLLAIGFSVYENFFDPQCMRYGIAPMPAGSQQGGHCVACIGYDLDFRNSEWAQWARNQGVPDSQIPAEVVECQNSWDVDAHREGRFVIPLDFITDPDLAGDFVTLRGFADENR